MNEDLKKIFLYQLLDVISEFRKTEKDQIPITGSTFLTRASATVERIVGRESEYYKRIEDINEKYKAYNDTYYEKVNSIIKKNSILLAFSFYKLHYKININQSVIKSKIICILSYINLGRLKNCN